MVKLPSYFVNSFTDETLQKINDWWTQLPEVTQQELAQMYQVESSSQFLENQTIFISLEMYEPYLEEVNSKKRAWVNNDYWLKGFTEYLVNHETYFFGHIPHYFYIRRRIDAGSARIPINEPYKYHLQKSMPHYCLADVLHLPQLETPRGYRPLF